MTSPPEEWMKALLPDKKKPTDLKHVVSVTNWCMYSNTKAMMLNTRQKKGIYPKFFLALHLLNGLNPSPQLKMKFKAQHDDPINGSDMCYQVFGKNAKKCHMHLRHSSHARIPCCLPTPSRKMHPKHKVQVPLMRRKRRRRRLLQPYQWLKLPYFHRRQ